MATAIDALKEKTGLTKKPITISEQLEMMKPQMARVLSKRVNPDRLVRIALTELRKNPTLAQCSPQSVLASVMIAAQLNLEFGVFGQCYMVPYKGTATFVPGWQGWVDLVSRSGRASAWTGEVRQGDEFDASLGSKPFIHHKPDFDGDEDRPLLYTYAVGKQTSAEHPVVEVWGRHRIEKHLNRYNRVGDKHYAKKDSHNFTMYARKIPLLQVVKYLPKSVELRAAASLEYASDAGTQQPTLQMAATILDGEYMESGEKQSATEIEAAIDLLGWTAEEANDQRKKFKGSDADFLAHLNKLIDEKNEQEIS